MVTIKNCPAGKRNNHSLKLLSSTMPTYHIHIGGLVQGVGFRPHVCKLAEEMQIKGWVCNSQDGVHIEYNAPENIANLFYKRLIHNPPRHSIITYKHMAETFPGEFTSFIIIPGRESNRPELLLTPDIAICDHCKREISDPSNRRYGYAFTTCLHCGPRYSIIKNLPYDRENTTMYNLPMCDHCSEEYKDLNNTRFFSQTNSCNDCPITMHLVDASAKELYYTQDIMPEVAAEKLKEGNIVAVKGIGGYLLLCDATNEEIILTLRNRKNRPNKPFALLYPDMAMADKDLYLRSEEIEAIKNWVAPIVLCRLKEKSGNNICTQLIAPGLDKLGLMLPYTPLLLLISQGFNRPLIATSGNISGSPVIYTEKEAYENLTDIADYILTYDRDIVTPQDDSVIQFTETRQKIILRRSRGLAPNYFPSPFENITDCTLGMGGELKSAFALLAGNNLYVSQYLGHQENLESQNCFTTTLHHLMKLLKVTPRYILADKHPGYFVSQRGIELANEMDASLFFVQHHKAHFAAVLAENTLLHFTKPVLGIIWDGAGYGEDEQIWGGEVFMSENNEMERIAHLDYFPQLAGDKMNKEPRLSALSLLRYFPNQQNLVKKYFSSPEWEYYSKLIQQPSPHLLTSSMGRFIDGIAAILGLTFVNTYEGEAAMHLEAMARTCTLPIENYYTLPISNGCIKWQQLLAELLDDLQSGAEIRVIARKVFNSLAKVIESVSNHFENTRLAFSGGVFQNALLTDIIINLLSGKKHLYFHQQLSPNDECIGFGQIAYFNLCRDIMTDTYANAEKLLI
jgi:hydrogenase maturation protein HypF